MRVKGKWTCKKCSALFIPESGRRICQSCAKRSCVICQIDISNEKADKKTCNNCRSIAALKRATEWYIDNKDKRKNYDAERRKEKRYLYREASRRYRESHPSEKKAEVISRRNGIKKQTPIWANKKYMNIFYKIAKLEQKRIGQPVHVDHIYPLNSDWVCGLHCEHNMQLLIAKDNIVKSNHYSLEHNGVK